MQNRATHHLAGMCIAMAVASANAQTADSMEQIFIAHPEKFSSEIIAAYRAKRIVPGMDPYLASRAGGAYQYRVEADPAKWATDYDPLRVIQAQAMHPDQSKIWMTFENSTQFPGQAGTRFKVTVEHGTVVAIEKISPASKAP